MRFRFSACCIITRLFIVSSYCLMFCSVDCNFVSLSYSRSGSPIDLWIIWISCSLVASSFWLNNFSRSCKQSDCFLNVYCRRRSSISLKTMFWVSKLDSTFWSLGASSVWTGSSGTCFCCFWVSKSTDSESSLEVGSEGLGFYFLEAMFKATNSLRLTDICMRSLVSSSSFLACWRSSSFC